MAGVLGQSRKVVVVEETEEEEEEASLRSRRLLVDETAVVEAVEVEVKLQMAFLAGMRGG
jgi:hypothetical protein